jgi:hypothetical protein
MAKGDVVAILRVDGEDFAVAVPPPKSFRIVVEGVSYDHVTETTDDAKVKKYNGAGKVSVASGAWIYAPTDRR